MITGRVLDVKKTQTKSGKDIFYVNVQVGQITTKYQCWDAAVEGMSGKEVSFTVKESDNPAFAATLSRSLAKAAVAAVVDGNDFVVWVVLLR